MQIITQKIYYKIQNLPDILHECRSNKTLIVCDNAFFHLSFHNYITELLGSYVVFHDFSSNPLYTDVVKGVELLNDRQCDLILAIGGGSAIDTAKCIKLFCKMNRGENYLKQSYEENDIPLIAIPTTAGTGSESTRFAVIYKGGEKQSVFHDAILPEYVILEGSALNTLPVYQKKCTMLDALCQSIESWWSVNSTDESKYLSEQALRSITKSMTAYFDNTPAGNDAMLCAANLAGQAINITQTTAAHAMSYKLTSLYHLPHGQAAALCLPGVWRYMLANMDKCTDPRGDRYLSNVFTEIADVLGGNSPETAVLWIEELLKRLEIKAPEQVKNTDLEILAASVNPVRLKNNPVGIGYDAAKGIYEEMLCKNKEYIQREMVL